MSANALVVAADHWRTALADIDVRTEECLSQPSPAMSWRGCLAQTWPAFVRATRAFEAQLATPAGSTACVSRQSQGAVVRRMSAAEHRADAAGRKLARAFHHYTTVHVSLRPLFVQVSREHPLAQRAARSTADFVSSVARTC